MDSVGCYGSEAKLIECSYHMDTSEDSHSGDVWIDCSTRSSSEPDGSSDNDDQSNDHTVTNGTSKGSSSNSVSSENDERALGLARTAVILGAMSLTGFLLVSVAFVSYIFCKKQSKIRKRMG